MAIAPVKVDLFAYNVYFGDCFLLVFSYPEGEKRTVLIDFGSTGKGKSEHVDENDESNKDTTGFRLLRVANHIKETCGDNGLDVVVATHRHKDHVYGFGLKEAGKIIRECKPRIVIQPWTEDPEDDRDVSKKSFLPTADGFLTDPKKNFASMLHEMHDVAQSIEEEAIRLGKRNAMSLILRDRIVFAADDNKVKNKAAVASLHAMGEEPASSSHYVYYDYDKIDWNDVLPGVKVTILGPPRLEDSKEITSATSTSDEFWSLQAMNQYFWSVQAATNRVILGNNEKVPLFSEERIMEGERPANVRWIINQLRSVRASQLLEIVKFIDSALNNTSVIMLFELGDQKLLFPGDAQIENWRYALGQPQIRELLKDVTLYKVGHHGSRNATPKSLWNNFRRRSFDSTKVGRLTTVISTMTGKHGETPDTAVPLPKMVSEMKGESSYRSTEDLDSELFDNISIDV